MSDTLTRHLGVKTDPVQYRYSYEWLFRLMADEGVTRVQLGTFFELYQLPDAWFLDLRAQAEACGVAITSCFTAHRELGGFFIQQPGWESVARKNFERYIEVGALLGARCVGSNPGAVLRDHMDTKTAGIACYIKHMKELMVYAHEKGLERLTIEPMSCLAEPPSLPNEIQSMAEALMEHHAATPGTVPIGYCTDIAHGYAGETGNVVHSHLAHLKSTVPWLTEIHLKNTDNLFNSTFGFSDEERAKGIVDVGEVVALLDAEKAKLPVAELTGYLEIGGPKLGRDYSDRLLEGQLRASLQHLNNTFVSP